MEHSLNCPNCGQAMEPGYLSAGGGRIKWTQKKRSLSALAGDREIPIQNMSFTGKNSTVAYLCRSCRKIVVDY